ncbi:troponin T, skeletal muscle-like [Gossypium australe]|uniref:Troponin T, skeletal muscle-like n=1 Tax=Gossypium australe TaxID=47621 RepID=A0A5B6WZI0_9ROSI|nr:troponin T, skeletal muscle-like [Gossypium australe]
MSQLINMMGDIKRQIGTSIPNNTKNNPRREGKEHVKVIALCSGKEESLEVDNELELKEVVAPGVQPKIKRIKDFAIAKILFPSRLEEKEK